MKFVLDTNILIDKLRGGTRWDEFLSSLSEDDEVFLPTIQDGRLWRKRLKDLKNILSKLT